MRVEPGATARNWIHTAPPRLVPSAISRTTRASYARATRHAPPVTRDFDNDTVNVAPARSLTVCTGPFGSGPTGGAAESAGMTTAPAATSSARAAIPCFCMCLSSLPLRSGRHVLVQPEDVLGVVPALHLCEAVPRRPRIGSARALPPFVAEEVDVCAVLAATQRSRRGLGPRLVNRGLLRCGVHGNDVQHQPALPVRERRRVRCHTRRRAAEHADLRGGQRRRRRPQTVEQLPRGRLVEIVREEGA